MAKHVILESYSFNKDTKTITVIGKNIRKEQLLLITNTTTGTVIYNFSDPALNSTSYVNAVDSVTGQETTTIVLNYNTAAMTNTDKISILVEETYQEIIPSETLRDPVDKLRVSTPQSLIDTDFEYGTQPTKWDNLNLLNNRPIASFDYTQGISNTSRNDLTFVGSNNSAYQITNVTSAAKVVTVAISNTTGITVGLPVYIMGTADNANVDGWWMVESVSTNVNFTFTVTNTPVTTALYDAFKTYVFIGARYTGSAIPLTSIVMSGTIGTVTTSVEHGLRVGDGFNIIGTTGTSGAATGAGTINSSWVVATTPTNNTFTFAAVSNAVTATLSAGATATLFPRSLGYTQHRAFDGGVSFSNEVPYHGYQLIRQTRRQFRYQSGKAIQFSTGSLMKPSILVENIASSGTTVTVTTKYAHGMLPGGFIRVQGCTETAYNGTFAVVTAASLTTLTYTALSAPSASPATGNNITVNPWSWYGSSNRLGMFDSQNGFFFEFDGQTLYAVRRSSTTQLAGVSAVTNASDVVTGTGSKFSSQLKPGDAIVIRGMTYFVNNIQSDTAMTVSPEYRGVTNSLITISKTIDTRYPQSTWNIDRCDGTGSSLYNIDLTKMQMFYCDYTWYGAGAIRFGFKNNRGEVIYCHRIANNNVNSEAYMRSGNLVARYETNTIPYRTFLTAAWGITTGNGIISVADTTGWPPSGTVIVKAAAATGAAIEYMTYSSKTTTSLTISGRAQIGGGVANAFTYSATAPILVELYSPQTASTISHWGSSVIMDGRFDDDKSLVFVAGQKRTQTITNIAQDATVPLISLRIAPTVDNGLTGVLGAREIINRMQLTLRSMSCQTTGTNCVFLITLRLNGRVSTGTFNAAGGSSLAQVAYHGAGATISGGEDVFGFYTNTPGVSAQDLSVVRDIGNSILGGGTSNTCPTTATNLYPDGPDILTICATNITAAGSNSINARISWTEAQA
jgi:hypothetical protein